MLKMPGPKIGTRPPDFDEDGIRKSPTFLKWLELGEGEELKYACRSFVKGHRNDEERLMRRIMIARRNNVRDHEILKLAREVVVKKHPEDATTSASFVANVAAVAAAITANEDDPPPLFVASSQNARKAAKPKQAKKRKERSSSASSNNTADDEMDEAAVIATRSYRTWMALADGKEFSYNQKYIKGREGHDFLLKKNIWRRMRYRRANKRMVQEFKCKPELASGLLQNINRCTSMKKEPASSFTSGVASIGAPEDDLILNDLVTSNSISQSNMPTLDASTLEFHGSALDAAYKLAAATANVEEVAAAVAAAIQGNNDDTTETEDDDDDQEFDNFHSPEEEEEEDKHSTGSRATAMCRDKKIFESV